MDNKIPSWIKLDNAATIYPSTLSRKYAAMFRMTVTLKEKVDKKILDCALNNVIKRFPSFSYKLKQGLFWCYFKHIDGTPDIEEDVNNPMLRIDFKKNNGFMFRIRYFDKRIAIEYFHALTDGTGAITFLLTLTGEYLRLKHNINIVYTDKILNPNDKASPQEYVDSFKKYARDIGMSDKEDAAYHIKGSLLDENIINIITGIIPIKNIKKESDKYNCTITQFLASVMILAFQEMQEKDNIPRRKKKSIKISIPVNLRKIYTSTTMRNFSYYVNVGIDTKYGHYTLEEIIKEVKGNMSILLNEKRLNAKITSNVNLANNYLVRLIPMFIKKHLLSMGERLIGDRYHTTTFSNLGVIDIPGEMSNYVKELGFMIGKARGKPGSCASVSYKKNLYISFSRKIKECEFERLFFTKLVEMGIPVTIESNTGGK